MAGDAAACVDPITGEGLYYALRSGDLLAQALVEGQPLAYPERLRAAFSADLEFAANIARKIFRGTFLGGAITTRMVQLLNYSPAFRDLIRDVFSGSQDYRSLKRRLWNQFGITALEFVRCFVNPPGSHPARRPCAESLCHEDAKDNPRQARRQTHSENYGEIRIGRSPTRSPDWAGGDHRACRAARAHDSGGKSKLARRFFDALDDRPDGARQRGCRVAGFAARSDHRRYAH